MIGIPVPATELDKWLPDIGWHLEQFAKDGSATPDDYVADIRDRKSQLWLAFDGRVRAAVLTELKQDRLKTCRVTHGAGDGMAEWIPLFGTIQDWAKEHGCKRMSVIARPGWEKMLKSFKMKKTHVVLEVGLDG
jgi:hypothetical protein